MKSHKRLGRDLHEDEKLNELKHNLPLEEEDDCCGRDHKHYDDDDDDDDCCCGHDDHHHDDHDDCCCGHDHHHHDDDDNDDDCGCGCEHHHDEKGGARRLDKESIRDIILLSISLVFLVVGYFNWKEISESSGQKWLLAFYYVNPAWVAVILSGTPLVISAVKGAMKKKLNSPQLITLAMIASIVLEILSLCGIVVETSGHSHSYVFAAGEIAFLMGLGELLEDLTVAKCRSGIERLVALVPKEAFVKVDDGDLVKMRLKDIKIGDIVVVKTGEMVAVDGKIVKGEASIDQSSLTGEYLPVDVGVGDSVFGGTMNKNGVIEVEVTKLEKDMTIAKMAELTVEAEGKKAPISRLADKAVKIILPIVLVTSLVVGLLAGFVLKVGWVQALVRAVTILVVFCPCALALATPTAVAAGLGNSAKHGVLVKSGAALESLARMDTICFDKTGTLTEGKIALDKVMAIDSTEEELIKLSASVEKFSEHPLARAVVEKAKGVKLYEAYDIETLQGVGVSAKVDGKRVLVESLKKARENGVDLSGIDAEIDGELSLGKTVVVVLVDDKLVGVLSFSDTIRDGAKDVLTSISKRGFKTVMLTGDNEKSAKYVAETCGVEEVKHSLLPAEKLEEIENMQKSGHKVVMVGDGVNDAPALKLADTSFAMGAMGSDIAVDSADITVMNSDLEKIDDTIKLSRRVMFAIRRNITISMLVNAVAVVLSFFGVLQPWSGALVHNASSVLVVASSALLLYNFKKKSKTQNAASDSEK